jgi:hypothetical protein
LAFNGTNATPYVAENDIPSLQLKKLTLNRPADAETSLVGLSLDFRTVGSNTHSVDQLGAGAFRIENDLIATNQILFAGGSATGLVTLNGIASGPGALRFQGGAWKITNPFNTFTGGIVVRDNAQVELAPAAGETAGVDLASDTFSIAGSNAPGSGVTINGGTLKLTTTGAGGISLSIGRRIIFNQSGGLLDLTNTHASDAMTQGGGIVAGDLAVTLNNSTAPAVIRFNGGQLGLSQNNAADGNWNANGNTLRIGLIAGSGGPLRVELDNGAYYSASVLHPTALTVRGKAGGDPTSGPTASVNTGIGTNFGRFSINDMNILDFHAGLRFEDAVEVSIPGASRQITGNITIGGAPTGTLAMWHSMAARLARVTSSRRS